MSTPNEPADVAALIAARDAKRRDLHEMMTVSTAEEVVATARAADLAAEQKAARRRLAAARGRLTKAQKDGSADRIAAARERVEQAWAEFDRISDTNIDEMFQISRARLDSFGQTLDQLGRTWDADNAVTDAIVRGPVNE